MRLDTNYLVIYNINMTHNDTQTNMQKGRKRKVSREEEVQQGKLSQSEIEALAKVLLEGGRLIPLTQGKFAIVDEDDYEFISQFKWCYCQGYARRDYRSPTGKRSCIFMHRLINKTPENFETDHINCNALDNRRCNLRNATRHQNVRNTTTRKDNLSGLKGVGFFKPSNKWRARIRMNGAMHSLGYFKTPELAHAAYCDAAKKLHGDFARTA